MLLYWHRCLHCRPLIARSKLHYRFIIKSINEQDNVHTNTESVQCISIVYSICPYKYNQWPFRPVKKSNSSISNVGQGKMKLAAFDSPSPKTPLYAQKFLTQNELQPILSQILLPWQRESVGEKCNWRHSMAHPRKPTYRRKNLAKISYTRRVIAHFVPNFVVMATRAGREKMQLPAFDGPSPKTGKRCKNLAKISYASRVIAHFVPNFVAMATREGPG